MGVMQALVSFVQDGNRDAIRSVIAGDHTFVFMNRDHLTFVGVTRGKESTQQMLLQLTYMYNQVKNDNMLEVKANSAMHGICKSAVSL